MGKLYKVFFREPYAWYYFMGSRAERWVRAKNFLSYSAALKFAQRESMGRKFMIVVAGTHKIETPLSPMKKNNPQWWKKQSRYKIEKMRSWGVIGDMTYAVARRINEYTCRSIFNLRKILPYNEKSSAES